MARVLACGKFTGGSCAGASAPCVASGDKPTANSGRSSGAEACRTVHGNGLQAEGVVACGNHYERDGRATPITMHMLGLEPRAEARIVDFGLTLPEIRRQAALDPKMIQFQFDGRNILWKIATDIIRPDVQSRETLTFALSFDHHIHLLFNPGRGQSMESQKEKACPTQ